MEQIRREMLNATEVAKILGVSTPMVYKLMHMQGFPARRIGTRRLVVPYDELKEWIDRQRITPEEQKEAE